MSTTFFFFNDTATTEIYTLSLHDALPIFPRGDGRGPLHLPALLPWHATRAHHAGAAAAGEGSLPSLRRRSEEHTSELQSRQYLVCRLLLEKKKNPLNSKNKLMTSSREHIQ